MSLDYDIETDGLYLLGIEKGIEKGIEIGFEKGFKIGFERGVKIGMTTVIRELISKNISLSDQEIAEMYEVDLIWVEDIRKSILQ